MVHFHHNVHVGNLEQRYQHLSGITQSLRLHSALAFTYCPIYKKSNTSQRISMQPLKPITDQLWKHVPWMPLIKLINTLAVSCQWSCVSDMYALISF